MDPRVRGFTDFRMSGLASSNSGREAKRPRSSSSSVSSSSSENWMYFFLPRLHQCRQIKVTCQNRWAKARELTKSWSCHHPPQRAQVPRQQKIPHGVCKENLARNPQKIRGQDFN